MYLCNVVDVKYIIFGEIVFNSFLYGTLDI